MNKTVLTSIILGGLLSHSAQGAPLLYIDYVAALEAPVSSELQQYARDGAAPERIMSILFKQSQKVTPESSSVFLDNVNFLLSESDYVPYQSSLRQLSIQTEMLNGDVEAGVKAIASLPPSEQASYRLLWAAGLLQLNRTPQAVDVFNALSPKTYQDNKSKALNIAQDMVVNHGVTSDSLHFPVQGDGEFALQLANFYEHNGLYAKSLVERVRRLSLIAEPSAQQAYRQTLIAFAKEHDLVRDERQLMEAYLTAAVAEEGVIGEKVLINEYSRLLVRYYFDKRNQTQQVRWTDEWLEAQRRLSDIDTATQQAYLENRLYRYNATRPDVFYSDVVALALLTQKRQTIVNEYSTALSPSAQVTLLEGFFALALSADNTTLAMADAYASLIEQCDDSVPMEVKVLKAHQFISRDEFDLAQQCFSSVIWEQVSLPESIISPFSQEQNQVNYMAMKQRGNSAAMIAMAQEGDSNMRLDAALFAVDAEPLTSERLDVLAEISVALALTEEQQQSMNARVNERLRQDGQSELLLPRLEQAPEENALDLAYWFMSQDQEEKAAEYLLMRLAQPEPLSEADEIKVVRYLDSIFSSLPQAVQQRVRQVSNEGVKMMLQLQAQEVSLASAFHIDEADMMTAIGQALAQYNQQRALLTSAPAANASAQLWLLGQLEWQLGQFLNQQMAKAPDALKPVLNKQVKQREAQAKYYVHQVVEQRIEGVMDSRVLDAVLFMEKN
ncbi:hypothetical protein C4G95_RS23045 [Vibrio parahaemolyticus]|nr:hypothetical protein [Vibrio parahaemolyticus]EIA1343590.1 hypothetical protein [Vibrio parahaemolyticus]EIA1590648.1 hypothetical protein [Vibrio parahaemolyticus]EIA1769759.1 hypothetical protein [Vibrio parahaemolyticus]EJG0961861.1 hypothetical protein [Vibrio parahaemolyticus]